MLAEIGVASIDDLFTSVPEEYRLTRDLNVPGGGVLPSGNKFGQDRR